MLGSRTQVSPSPLRADQMKPKFALNLSHEGISILHRTKVGWMCVGDVSLEDPELSDQLAVLRRTAADLESSGVTTKLVIPNSQILYTEVHAPGPDTNAQMVQIRQGLEGKTPYEVNDLVFDWRSIGQSAQVAVVFRESLKEAESFAVQHGFNPVSFVANPEFGSFEGEPFFGATEHSRTLFGQGEEIEPDPEPMIILGSDKPHGKATEHQVRHSAPDYQEDTFTSAPQYSDEAERSANGPHPSSTERSPIAGQSRPNLVTAHMPLADSRETFRLPVRGDQGLTRMPVTSSRIAGSGPPGTVVHNADGQALPSEDSRQGAVPNLTGRYQKLGSALSAAGARHEQMALGFHRPSRMHRWPRRLMIVLFALLLVLAGSVGLLFWISPNQLESSLSQFWRFQTSQQETDGVSAPIQESQDSQQAPAAEIVPARSDGPVSADPVLTDATVGETGSVPALPDISANPPPDRILQPPPSFAESERTYLDTGVWPRDPRKPAGVTDDDRLEEIYVASMDRVTPPRIPAIRLAGSFRPADPHNPQALASVPLEVSGYRIEVVDSVPVGSQEQDSVDLTRAETAGKGTTGSTSSSLQAPAGSVVADLETARDSSESPPVPDYSALHKMELDDLWSQGKLLQSNENETADETPGEAAYDIQNDQESIQNLALAISPIPKARPKGLSLAARRAQIEAAGNGTSAEARQSGSTETAAAKRNPVIPASVPVATQATQRNAINLGKVNLIGTYGPTGERYALVRLRSGRFIKNVRVGDRIDGGRVTAIGASELHYVKNGRSITLRLPAG